MALKSGQADAPEQYPHHVGEKIGNEIAHRSSRSLLFRVLCTFMCSPAVTLSLSYSRRFGVADVDKDCLCVSGGLLYRHQAPVVQRPQLAGVRDRAQNIAPGPNPARFVCVIVSSEVFFPKKKNMDNDSADDKNRGLLGPRSGAIVVFQVVALLQLLSCASYPAENFISLRSGAPWSFRPSNSSNQYQYAAASSFVFEVSIMSGQTMVGACC